MIRINLLPHRETKRRERRKQFYVTAGLMIALGATIGLAGHLVIQGRIDHQTSRNKLLQTEIRALDKQLTEIQDLRAKIDALIARKQVIETLQRDRAQPVFMFNDLIAHLPEGVYLRTLRQQGARITLTGHAQSNARVSHVMRSFEEGPTMADPQLVEVKSVSVDKRRLSDFTLSVGLVRPPEGEGESKATAKGVH